MTKSVKNNLLIIIEKSARVFKKELQNIYRGTESAKVLCQEEIDFSIIDTETFVFFLFFVENKISPEKLQLFEAARKKFNDYGCKKVSPLAIRVGVENISEYYTNQAKIKILEILPRNSEQTKHSKHKRSNGKIAKGRSYRKAS